MGVERSPRLRGAAQPPLAPCEFGAGKVTHSVLDRSFSRQQFLRTAGAGGLFLLTPSWARAANLPPAAQPRGDSVVVRWNQAILQGVRESKLGPPMVSRALAIVHTCACRVGSRYPGPFSRYVA